MRILNPELLSVLPVPDLPTLADTGLMYHGLPSKHTQYDPHFPTVVLPIHLLIDASNVLPSYYLISLTCSFLEVSLYRSCRNVQ